MKLAYSSAFRAPSWDETETSSARRIQAVELQPERVRSGDLNVQHQFGAHRLLVGGFYSHWDSLVELVQLSEDEAIAAIGDGKTLVPFTPTPERQGSAFVMKFHPRMAPIKAAVFPLVNKDGMPEVAEKLYRELRQQWRVDFDEKQSIGKRYARMDEAGTPFCFRIGSMIGNQRDARL